MEEPLTAEIAEKVAEVAEKVTSSIENFQLTSAQTYRHRKIPRSPAFSVRVRDDKQ
jgi:hypothetical protein